MPPERSDSSPFPLDFDALRKGDVIQPETICAAYDVTRDSRDYQFAALRLKGRIEAELAERGYPVTTKIERDAIRILSDSEAVDYNGNAFEHGVSSMARAHRRLMSVDVEQLQAIEGEKHERLLLKQATQLLALRNARRAPSELAGPAAKAVTEGTR